MTRDGCGRHDRIVEIAALTLDPQTWQPVDEYDTLVNPERDVGPTGLHGITPSMVEAAPTFSEIATALSRRLHGSILVAHNLAFDTRMLGYEFERLRAVFNAGSGLCTYRATGEKLVMACNRCGIGLSQQHRALTDARATAELAREVLSENEADTGTVGVGYLPHVPNPRTLRRETAGVEVSEMARIVSLAHYPYSDEALLLYLDALNWVLDDHHIDEEERAAIKDFAAELGLSDRVIEDAHRSYLASIIAAAKRDGIVTDSEQWLIRQVMQALEITDVRMPMVTLLPSMSPLATGMRVCFTGEAVVGRSPVSLHFLEECAAQAGLQPVASVTKRSCDLLVAADVSSQSGKARNARRYGIPVMGTADFLEALGLESPPSR